MDGVGQPAVPDAHIPAQPAPRRASVMEMSLSDGRDELQLLRAAVEGGLDGMVVVSADGVMVTYNQRFHEMWPIPADVVASGSDAAALASVLDKLEDPDAFLARVRELYDRASGTSREDLQLRDGRTFDRFGTALRDEDGAYIGWAWYFRDVTEERAAAADAARHGALVAVAQALGDAQSEDDVLQVVGGLGVAALAAHGAALCLSPGETGPLRVLATSDFDDDVRAEVAELPRDFPIPIAAVAGGAEPLFLPDRAAAVALFPAAEDLYVRTGTDGSAAVPLVSHGSAFGALAVAYAHPHSWRRPDRDLLLALASLTAQAIDRIRAQDAEEKAADQVRRLSESLQRSLLAAPPQSPSLHIAVRYQPAAQQAQVGGDWYDAFSTPGGSTTLVVGDVAGHDSSAAAAMAQVRNVLRGVGQTLDASPGEVLQALDGALHRLQVGVMATAVLCRACSPADDGSVALTWSNAGHPPPLLLHPDGTAELLAHDPELLLGMQPDWPRTDHSVDLPPGATLVLYTDGLVERRGEGLDEGLERVVATAGELHALSPDDLVDGLLTRLAAGAEDDVALLVVRVRR